MLCMAEDCDRDYVRDRANIILLLRTQNARELQVPHPGMAESIQLLTYFLS